MDREKTHTNHSATSPDALQLQDAIFRYIVKASDTRGFQYLSTAILGFIVICVLNWLWTYQQRTKASAGGGPPMIPHWIPWLGNALSFIRDFDGFDAWVQSVMPPHTPYLLTMGGQKIIYVNSPTLYTKAVQMSKQLAFDPLERTLMCRLFVMPQSDMDRYEVGMNLGGRALNSPYDKLTESQAKELAMSTQFWRQYQDNMFGDGLAVLSDKILQNFTVKLDEKIPLASASSTSCSSSDWTTVDMVDLQKEVLYKAAVEVLFGCWLKESGSEIWKDFWEFEEGFMSLYYEYPAFLCRKTMRARQKLLDAIVKWLKICEKEAGDVSSDVMWEEYWGSRMQRQRDATTRGGGLSYAGRAAHHLGLMFALNGNTIPSIIWIIYYTLKQPGLLQRLHNELTSTLVLTYDSSTNLPIIDATRLSSLPLLNSVYKETLRLVVSSVTTRSVVEDTELAGYKLRKDTMLIMPGRPLQISPANWTSASEHPTNQFWAERFVDENDASNDIKEKKKKDNCWKPFGGGKSYCMGRYLAAAEIMGGLAVMIGMFDMELANPKQEAKIDQAKMGRGGMLPDSKVMIKLRRRKAT